VLQQRLDRPSDHAAALIAFSHPKKCGAQTLQQLFIKTKRSLFGRRFAGYGSQASRNIVERCGLAFAYFELSARLKLGSALPALLQITAIKFQTAKPQRGAGESARSGPA
jgi:hypothetical protein